MSDLNDPKYFIRADKELLAQYEKEEGHGIPQFFLDYAERHNEKNLEIMERNRRRHSSSGGFGGGHGFSMLIRIVDEPLIPVLHKYGMEPYNLDQLSEAFKNIIKKKYPDLSLSEVYDEYVIDKEIGRSTFYLYVNNTSDDKERKRDTALKIAIALKFSEEEWNEIAEIFDRDINKVLNLFAENNVADEDMQKILKVFRMSES